MGFTLASLFLIPGSYWLAIISGKSGVCVWFLGSFSFNFVSLLILTLERVDLDFRRAHTNYFCPFSELASAFFMVLRTSISFLLALASRECRCTASEGLHLPFIFFFLFYFCFFFSVHYLVYNGVSLFGSVRIVNTNLFRSSLLSFLRSFFGSLSTEK